MVGYSRSGIGGEMSVEVTRLELQEVRLLKPAAHEDERGHFMELFRDDGYAKLGVKGPFLQDNLSHSRRNVLRGLHYQYPTGQGKLITCVRGTVQDVAVDVRRGSPFFGKWVCVELSEENHHQLYIPPGFAHGFSVMSDVADLIYKCTGTYVPAEDRGVHWADADLAVDWSVSNPIISEKDAGLPFLKNVPGNLLPNYEDRD